MLRKLGSAVAAQRIAGAAGIGFALLIVAANLVLVPAGMPPPGSSADEAIEFFLSADQPTLAVSALLPAVWALATLFAAGALAATTPAGGRNAWAYAGFAGVLLQNATFTVVVAVRLAMTTVDDPAGIGPLWALHEAVFGFNGTFLALAMLGLGTAGFVTGLLARWQLILGIVAGCLQFASALVTPLIVTGHGHFSLFGLVGWLLWAVWLTSYGITLIRSAGHTHPNVGNMRSAGHAADAHPD
ncbi:2-oxoglutarate/malate transporter [Nocardia flavorosea]|uniref:2-oxoglutarate/malate transporter n=1 Tax=Nocardia flavorosea TaxID=53429 RepID=UPI0018960BE8|nr:2-oxoglutarate/malate transporter [Nocardia flavorosea]MBF6351988.1 2-oxoglutarate/malate transporter [Nocardia flavorosea]